jgi:phosphopantothenoylcysteine decarboxylase/phosphopantothenate--cysteine ligase
VQYLENFFAQKQTLTGKKILITAGPTYEKIDPVRFIGNYSSGKMGYALAETCAERGAEVILISGRTDLTVKHPNIQRIDVESAEEMYRQVISYFAKISVGILAAAVADYAPKTQSDTKLKKKDTNLILELQATKDIAAELGKIKTDKQILVGFALETDNEEANAKEKLKKKNFDFIVLNSLKDKNAAFGYDTNKIMIIDKNGNKEVSELKCKTLIANDIIDKLETLL